MTDGILLGETQGDRELRQYDSLIIDEAHERSLNIDFLLGYVKHLLTRRPDLKLVITSATIDAERFSKHFDGAPVIEVSGRLYPVEVRYHPVESGDEDYDLNDAIGEGGEELGREGQGDVLVFLPGEREIREAAEALRNPPPPHTEILPLFARLSAEEQERVFKPPGGRRSVLATNVAETSLTVPGVRYVVDTGLARVKRYSYRSKVEQLRVKNISQASAKQRAGRCGRVARGVCIRLCAEEEFNSRPAFTDPEVLRSSLANVILRMKSLGLGTVEEFPFIDPPSPKAVQDGYALLAELGAVDDENELTETGRQLAKLPVDPRIGRMILAAKSENALREVLVIAAALSVQDPRQRPSDRAAAADEAQKQFNDEKSDFLSWLKLWKFFEEALEHGKSSRKLHEACREHFLSFNRMREWRDIHGQLKELVAELGWRISETPATYRQVHQALLAGLLGHVGTKTEEGNYLGARGIRFWIHPGSGVRRKAGRWVMAAELTETTRLYARCVATVEAEWLEAIGGHLVKRHQYEPHWEKQPARVAAFERGTLYGLLLYSKRRVHYGPTDPAGSRKVFIRQALVEGDYDTRAPFFLHNRRLVREIEQLEHKSRRPDVLVDDELIHAFYESLVPEGVHNGADFDRWRRDAEANNPRLLFLKREDLMRHEAAGITTAQFPHELETAGRSFAQLRAELGQKAGEQSAELARADTQQEKVTAWEFGDLEEVMEIRRGSQTLMGYPGLVDHVDSVSLEVFDSADRAREAHRAGLRRLFRLQLKEQARHIEKNLPGPQAMALPFAAFGEVSELKEQLLAAAFDRACMQEPWPRSRAEFERRRDEARSRVTLLAQEIARLAGTILAEHAALLKKLEQTSKAFPEACRDVQESAARLMPRRFIEQTPYERLQHFPRYLKAGGLRLDKLRADPHRDARLAAEFAPLAAQWQREQARQLRSGNRDPQLEQFRWLLEGLRVQLFAQGLETSVPVSVKRLSKMWQTIQR